MKRIVCTLSIVAVVALAIAATGTGAPPRNGCPAAYETITVADAASQGYAPVPRNVDNAGNQNGVVCRHPVGDGVFHNYPGRPDTIYNWIDDKSSGDG